MALSGQSNRARVCLLLDQSGHSTRSHHRWIRPRKCNILNVSVALVQKRRQVTVFTIGMLQMQLHSRDRSAAERAVVAEPGVGADIHRALEWLRAGTIGIDTEYPIVGGQRSRRIYLDSSATSLRLGPVQKVLDAFQPHYANTHSSLHYGARLSSAAYAWAHEAVLSFVRAHAPEWMCFFVGNGATGAINRIAQSLRAARPERDAVITTVMEHHSNDLPHRKHFARVIHLPVVTRKSGLGAVDLGQLERELQAQCGRVNYVAVTGVSNVTGIVNPVEEIARIAHRYDALIVVDGAQMTAHVPLQMSGHADPAEDLDVLAFSGHKVYAPGSPGVVVARSSLFSSIEPVEVGGGMVEGVWVDRYVPTQRMPDREEAGTPNITGAIGLGAALYTLQRIGMKNVQAEEERLLEYLLSRLAEIPGLIVYGDSDTRASKRAGAVAFNIEGMDHALTAAILNDHFNIAVRNECFCAHPYVREMIMSALGDAIDELSNEELERRADEQRGMVRASFGIYTILEDVDRLVEAVKLIAEKRETFAAHYEQLPNGDYRHRSFRVDVSEFFSPPDFIDAIWPSP